MADYPLGQQITIDRTFYEDEQLVDPDIVRLTIELPSGTQVEYEFGVNADLENDGVGYYFIEGYLPPSPGKYDYEWSTANPHIVARGSFTVGVSALGEVVPTVGPCEPWTTAEDVAEVLGSSYTQGTDTGPLEEFADIASDVLFQITTAAWPGECGPITVRPCTSDCGCWSIAANRGGAWAWDPYLGRWMGSGRSCGCSPLSEVELAGNPRSIIEVKIDGVVLDPAEYRLDTQGRLVRMRDDAEPDTRLLWPSCQIADLDDTEEGTFSVEYTFGLDPPPAGRKAAEHLAAQMWLAENNSGRCKLPANAREVVRGSTRIELGTMMAEALRKGQTGILAIDAFIAAYGPVLDSQGRIVEESTVWSPDLAPQGRRML